MNKSFSFLLILCLLFSYFSSCRQLNAKIKSKLTSSTVDSFSTVISTGDGDTLRIDRDGEEQTVRLACIDSPERNQTGGQEAADRLRELLPRGQVIQVRTVDRDRYGREVAEVYLNGASINLQLVQEGMAVVYHQYLDSCNETQELYLQAEAEAQLQQRGVWSQLNLVMPWDWRNGSIPATPSLSSSSDQNSDTTIVDNNFPPCVNSDCDCQDFSTQIEAQRLLDAFEGDPHRLDGDNDDWACESLP